MIKLRIEGLAKEIETMVENLKTHYEIVEISKPHLNHGKSNSIRIYLLVKQK